MKSMTGFGHFEVSDEYRKISVEMKAVNHRYFDANIRMPKKLMMFENAARNVLKNYIERGKVDVFITYENVADQSAAVAYNSQIAATYMEYFRKMSEEFSIENDITVSKLSRFPEVLTLEETSVDEEEVWKLLEEALRKAAEAFVASRQAEGINLKKDLLEKLDLMLEGVNFIESYSPSIVEQYREKLEAKIREVLSDAVLDENRIATEVTIFADKICVDEETVRLKSHIQSMKQTFEVQGSIGKTLDFIAQEMNREANTIMSKANNLEITNHAITLKTCIEKVREQIQNIE